MLNWLIEYSMFAVTTLKPATGVLAVRILLLGGSGLCGMNLAQILTDLGFPSYIEAFESEYQLRTLQ